MKEQGVTTVTVRYDKKEFIVSFNDAMTTPDAIMKSTAAIGFPSQIARLISLIQLWRVLDRMDLELDDLARKAQLLITMGCGDKCPFVPGLRRDDWPLRDPKGAPIEEVRATRDDIRGRVQALLNSEGLHI